MPVGDLGTDWTGARRVAVLGTSETTSLINEVPAGTLSFPPLPIPASLRRPPRSASRHRGVRDALASSQYPCVAALRGAGARRLWPGARPADHHAPGSVRLRQHRVYAARREAPRLATAERPVHGRRLV